MSRRPPDPAAVTRPLVIGHRGDPQVYPENTLAGFMSAHQAGSAGIELDVRLSADGIPVVCHDANLARFGAGGRAVAGRTLKQLRSCDLGRWFSPRFAGTAMPTLAEVLATYPGMLLVEIKQAFGPGARAADLRLVRAVVATIQASGAQRRVLILSFCARILAEVAARAPALRLVRTIERKPRQLGAFLAGLQTLYGICVDQRVLAADLVDGCHASGLRVLSYTCNTIPVLKRLVKLRVDVLLSDRPGWLRRALGSG